MSLIAYSLFKKKKTKKISTLIQGQHKGNIWSSEKGIYRTNHKSEN